jgi:hypothetical protein
MIKLAIFMSGGCIQDIQCTDPDGVEVIIVDMDDVTEDGFAVSMLKGRHVATGSTDDGGVA